MAASFLLKQRNASTQIAIAQHPLQAESETQFRPQVDLSQTNS